jgi:hypothetical protein
MFNQEPEDILETAEPAFKKGTQSNPGTPLKQTLPSSTPISLGSEKRPQLRNWIILIIAVAIFLGIMSLAVIKFFKINFSGTKSSVLNAEPLSQAETALPPEENALTSQPLVLDTDGDGLKDDEEEKIGTDPTKSDTDADGLSDFEEANTWQTNPLKADTDGDGYPDGVEVKNGYNPNGEGKL